MKTDLAKILTVSGTHGLYEFVAQTSAGGAIAESLATRSRTAFGRNSRISSLAEKAIYTTEGEMKLDEVFTALHGVLGESPAPSSKDSKDAILSLFQRAIPNYDSDRFYISHMKKVVDWYNELSQFASLDFVCDSDSEED